MRANVPDYELVTPRNLGEALALLHDEPGSWRPFAGGTDLMVLFESGRLAHKKFFNIRQLDELRGITETAEHVTLGALTSYTEVLRNASLQRQFPMLCRAASETGGPAIQNRGTLGGNIANASPAADSPPALLAYGAQLELVSTAGARWIDYADFHTGYKRTLLRADELVARIRLPRPLDATEQFSRKVGTRRAQAISKICFAGLAEFDAERVKDIRLAFGSVAPTVVRCPRTEETLKGQKPSGAVLANARAALARELTPIDDIRSTAKYRLRVASNLLEEFIAQLSVR